MNIKTKWAMGVAMATAMTTVASTGRYMVIDLTKETSTGEYLITYLNEVPASGWTDEYKGDKLVLRRIEAGSFLMGSPESEVGREYRSDLGSETLHEVQLTKDYYIGIFEVTQRQYLLVTGINPSIAKGELRPVDNVSYNDVRGAVLGSAFPKSRVMDSGTFLRRMSLKTGLAVDLPTEAQWEYACRAGTISAFNDGSDLTDVTFGVSLTRLGRFAMNQWDGRGGYTNGTTVVGSYRPNAWGLYDMHGNVAEWCLDWWSTFNSVPQVDPVGPNTGTNRVVRGGFYGGTYFWYGVAASCRSAFRGNRCLRSTTPNCRFPYFGFRVAITTP